MRKMSKYYLGIDTSNYTTSIAIIDEKLNIIHDERILLKVVKGSKGLRQQEALFQHLKNLPILFERVNIDINSLESIAVSTKPRQIDGSYMPVFLAGEGFARTISALNNIKMKRFSHQEGHIGGLLLKEDISGGFFAIHLSGGTTEVLKCMNKRDNLSLELVGGSLDISIGQLIDRIGVYLGLNFPCGQEMDVMAANGKRLKLGIDVIIKNGYFNLSGLENKFKNLLDEDRFEREDLLFTLFSILGELLLKLVEIYIDSGDEKILFVGGVASNRIIRDNILNSRYKENIIFTDARLSTDNAVGISYLGMKKVGWEE